MTMRTRRTRAILTAVLAIGAVGCVSGGRYSGRSDAPSTVSLAPASMARVGSVHERYQSYNVEMLEVTGGKFWRPYGPELDAILRESRRAPAASSTADTPAGIDPRLYQYRPPIDLANARLRKLAAALGPAYVRVSGTWANTTYFAESDQPPATPPRGFGAILSQQQWKGVIEFAKAVNADIVTSFATGTGTRDAGGAWKPDEARRWVSYTRSVGGTIAAAEFMNEPTLAAMGGAPPGYDAAAYGRDFKLFRGVAREMLPEMVVLGPGSVGETTGTWGISYGALPLLATRDMLAASRPATVDAFSYHHYGASSQRCAAMDMQTTATVALSEKWLRRTDETLAFYRRLRDEFAPGKTFWLTETADAACGGNPWANSFLDTFRYVAQLGRLAKQQVTVVIHNTLAASDYGLLDDKANFRPKPNYWAAVLWRTLMGTTVLESGVPIAASLHVYAHCLRGGARGGVAVLAINTDKTASRTLTVPVAGRRYTLSSPSANLQERQVQLNGRYLEMTPRGDLPPLDGVPITAGALTLPPATISFLALPDAGNAACG